MKSPSNDNRHRLLINGDELTELKRHASDMPESKGLDRRIESYKGIRPITFEHSELGSLVDLLDDALIDPDKYPDQTTSAYLALKKLRDRMHQEYIVKSAVDESINVSPQPPIKGKSRKKAAGNEPPKPVIVGYQFKITLRHSQPPIWRRILLADCNLYVLHEHIQSAMGWQSEHLHCFRINKKLYTDIEFTPESFDDSGYNDSLPVKLSDFLPGGRKTFKFEYEYDFGDSWEHDILFEKRVEVESPDELVVCLEGERACPPEDVGGIWGYYDFLEAIQDENHERHEDFLEWIEDSFDPEAFDAESATLEMRDGWEMME